MVSGVDTQSRFVTAARELAPLVAEAADRNDRDRRVTPKIAAAIADRGLFRLLVPRSLGGGEIDWIEYLSIVQTFAEADGSTGWCINQNNVYATVSASMPVETAREIWGNPRAVVTNGPPTFAEAVPEDNGYRLTGRWNFSSGFRHATWLAAATPVRRPEHDGGDREVRTMLLPKHDAIPVDVWEVGGLRGTGSFSFRVEDLFVPAIRTFVPETPHEEGPIYVIPMSLLFAAGFATVALGVARSGLDAAIELATVKRTDLGLLADSPITQREIGRAEAVHRSARAFLLEAVSTIWESACNTRSLSVEDRVLLRLAATHAIHMAASVVDIAYTLCGSDAIFAANPIQRRFQDVHAITQQSQGRLVHYDSAGQFFLGSEPKGAF